MTDETPSRDCPECHKWFCLLCMVLAFHQGNNELAIYWRNKAGFSAADK